MRNFVILFNGREGTTPLVRVLDHFPRISILHGADGGWEPFDLHQRGTMTLPDLLRCVDGVLAPGPTDVGAINEIYTRTATGPLAPIPPGDAVGFKMRFRWRYREPSGLPAVPGVDRVVRRMLRPGQVRRYRAGVIDILRRNRVVVFVAVRQDVLRLGLSKYHGDGAGGPGHLQFRLASGAITRDDLGPITVDCDRLERLIEECEQVHDQKRALVSELAAAGVECVPLRYEEFLTDAPTYFERLVGHLGGEVTPEEIAGAVRDGAHLEKVHSDDISDFVTNHAEVLERFGDRYVRWPAEVAPS